MVNISHVNGYNTSRMQSSSSTQQWVSAPWIHFHYPCWSESSLDATQTVRMKNPMDSLYYRNQKCQLGDKGQGNVIQQSLICIDLLRPSRELSLSSCGFLQLVSLTTSAFALFTSDHGKQVQFAQIKVYYSTAQRQLHYVVLAIENLYFSLSINSSNCLWWNCRGTDMVLRNTSHEASLNIYWNSSRPLFPSKHS